MSEKEEVMKSIKEGFKNAQKILSNKKIQTILIVVLLLLIVFFGTFIRLQNIPLLKNSATGEAIPLALDPFYFLRVAETSISWGGLTEYDEMRYSVIDVPWTTEITPKATLFWFKVLKIFNPNVSLAHVHNLNPVLFFILGIILFFFIVLFLTKSKWIGIISAGLLAIIPPYLYRTLAGFADHESIGMFAFFAVLLVFSLSIAYLNKKNKKISWKFIIPLGLITGFLSAFSAIAWGGIAKFGFMIIPLSFIIIWLVNVKNKDFKFKENLWFYASWFFSSIIFACILGLNFTFFIKTYILNLTGLLAPFTLLFILFDYFFMKKGKKLFRKELSLKKRILASFISTIIVALIIYQIFMGNVFTLIKQIWETLIHPFGTGRVGLTIAENKQPYLSDWWNQIGKTIFWIFFVGVALLGANIARGIKKKKNKILFVFAWIVFISGILFSRISAVSALNGENGLSQFVYIISVLIFIASCIWIYLKDELKIDKKLIIIASWLILMLVAARGAVRLFFAIVPFTCFMTGYSIVNFYNLAKKNKDEFIKTIFYLLFVLAIIGLIFSSVGFAKTTINQAKYTGPSANSQWQYAMNWANENTPKDSLFMHWWDYGYWVQYLGKRATVTDGGHYNGYWDHLIGRYVLTTPNPETAKSFAKAHKVSHLLIDQTDIGKYPAYSSIGSDGSGQDRNAWIPTMLSDSKEVQETRDGLVRLYRGGTVLDQDIVYEDETGKTIFLPAGKAFVGGFFFEKYQDSWRQPQGIYIYNNQQLRLPIRYVYLDGILTDFKEGINATVYIFPKYEQGSSTGQLDKVGAALYLSEKVKDSLVAQLFLMDDPNNLYPEFKLVHVENSYYVNLFKFQNMDIGNFVYFNGVQGPIKIWEITHSNDIIARQEFLNTSGDYAELDNLQFII